MNWVTSEIAFAFLKKIHNFKVIIKTMMSNEMKYVFFNEARLGF